MRSPAPGWHLWAIGIGLFAVIHVTVQVMAGFQICAAAGTCPW